MLKGIFTAENQGNALHQDFALFIECKNRVLITNRQLELPLLTLGDFCLQLSLLAYSPFWCSGKHNPNVNKRASFASKDAPIVSNTAPIVRKGAHLQASNCKTNSSASRRGGGSNVGVSQSRLVLPCLCFLFFLLSFWDFPDFLGFPRFWEAFS